ncbi:MAG: hypothetical protein RJA07_1532 [Bacteroidota bacterium]|jgi:hypothetical protein
MKIQLIIIAIIIFGSTFFACEKRDFICNCTTTDSTGVVTATIHTSLHGNKTDVQKQCENLSSSKNGKTTLCGL